MTRTKKRQRHEFCSGALFIDFECLRGGEIAKGWANIAYAGRVMLPASAPLLPPMPSARCKP